MDYQKVNFKNKKGETLAAYLDKPVDDEPKAYVLFAHCFTCNKNLKGVKYISKALTNEGFGVLRFDFTGLGESEGDFADTNFSSNVDDLLEAAQFLENHFEGPSILVGHSLGGAAVLLAASQILSVKAIATVGAPSKPDHVTKHFQHKIPEIKEEGEAIVNIGGRDFQIRNQFIKNLEKTNLDDHIHNLRRPLLIMHSPIDQVVGIDNAGEIFQAAQHPKSFVALDEADHLLMKSRDAQYVGQMISAWSARYIPEERKENGESQLETEKQVVAKTGQDSLTTEVKSGKHHFLVDEPESAGGNNLGPNPYDYLAAALGSCTSLTLQMYARHKKWPLDEARVHVQHKKAYEKDCENAEESHAKIDVLEREIEVLGDLDETQQKRLIEIANKCPVHRTLTSDIKVKTWQKGKTEG